jgi:hypothetical protein
MALVFRLWVEQGCGNGLVRGWIGYDDVSLAVTRVRYENTATNADMDFQLFKPESESPDGTSIFDGARSTPARRSRPGTSRTSGWR